MQKTQLQTSELGATGLEITRIGFGAWAIGVRPSVFTKCSLVEGPGRRSREPRAHG
jgi:hypothetical protein